MSSQTIISGRPPQQPKYNTPISGNVSVEGIDAQGAPITAKPVLSGGIDPNGNAKGFQTADDGDQIVHQHSESTSLADGVNNTMHIPVNQTDLGFLGTPVAPFVFNGTTWDRTRGNKEAGAFVTGAPLSIRMDDGSTYLYVGKAATGSATSGAVWQVCRITQADTTVLWADGNGNFDNVWDNRASLTYS